MATDVDGTLPRSMSLSRRYLSLPQELLGTSLPPNVSGKRRGFVTLCVAHILPSVVSSSPLPRESLVRVRWWGEEAPGSLFRPQLLSDEFYSHKTRTDEASYSPHRAISMKYPVTVLPEQLLEYFEDMGNLTLEVIDRDSRKKYGECLLPLNLQKDNQVMTAEEKLVALRRENVLCEVKFCGEDEVAGYLAVTFDVNWTERDVEIEENVERDVKIEDHVENMERFVAGSSVSSSLPSNREWVKVDSQGADFEDLEQQRQRNDIVKNRGRRDDFIRIQKLLEKGKALQQSMEKAVKDKGDGEELDGAIADEVSALSDVVVETQSMLRAPLFTLEPDFAPEYSKKNGVLATGRPKSPKLAPLSDSTLGVRETSAAAEQVNTRLNLPEQLNMLMISFESLELNRDFIDSQLRQLRDASSVSSRSSPIQIHVLHDGTSSLLSPHLTGEHVPEVPGFTVSTSLRKREWQLNCFSTVPLTQSSRLLGGNSNESGSTTWNQRDKVKQFRFLVRCENQSDSRRNKRRREKNLFPRSSQRVLLEGAVGVAELLAVAKRVDKTWATTVQLRLERSDHQLSDDHNVDELNKARKRKQRPVGYLKLKFAFNRVDSSTRSSVSETKSAEDKSESELLLSSISSNPSEVKVEPDLQISDAVSDLLRSGCPLDRHAQLLQSSLKNSTDTYKSVQFAVMLDDVSTATLSSLSDRRVQTELLNSDLAVAGDVGRGGEANLLAGASISLQYTFPSHFSKTSRVSDKFERIITRKLKASRWCHSSSLLWADFSGNTHVFQSSFADDSCEYLSSSYLIVEVWAHTLSDSRGRLLGLAKVPLRELADILRADETDLSTVLKQTLPVVSVDDRFPIENPFTGQTSGYLRGRICLGTAEQILTWSKTIRAVIKVQGILRGVSFRQHFRGFISATPRPDLILDEPQSVELSSVDNRSESQSTAPTLAPGIRVTGFKDNSADDLKAYETVPESCEWRAILRTIRFHIRENWRSATRQKSEQRGWSGAPLLGCELQGQLILAGDKELPAKVKGVPFALWWDAADSKLNSSFVHVFRSKRAHQIAGGVDGTLVGPQSQVLFALHVENGFFGTQSRETIMGEARLNLFETICKHLSSSEVSQNTGAGESMIDVDIPIEWSTGGSGFQKLASSIPLKISYQISLSAEPESILVDELREDFYNDGIVDTEHDAHIDLRDAAEKRLKPASIAISFCLLSVTGFKHLLDEKRRYLFAASLAEMNLSSVHLRDILNSSHDVLSAFFEIKVCLGEELDEREKGLNSVKEVEFTRDTTARVFADNGNWFKRWRSPEVSVRVTGTSQIENLEKLSHQLSMQAYMLLNPVTVANLQEECAQVTMLLSCSSCGEPHILGCIEVPLAAVLFRPQGVRGMFPICIGKEPTAARIGVHCFIDHTSRGHSRNESDGIQIALYDTVPSYSDIQLIPGLTPPLISPTSPDKIIRTERNPLKDALIENCEVFIEEGRNLVVNNAETTPRLYATFDMVNERVSAAIHEPNATSGKRTDAKDGKNPWWNFRETLSVDNMDRHSLSLEVSVWMEDKSPPTGPTTGKLPHPGHDVFVGMVRVDLSLFSRGWSDIDGWYHIQDAQHLTRGQIKIHVRNLSVESKLSPKAVASSWKPRNAYQEEPAVRLDRHNIRSVTDDAEPTQFSLDDGEHAVQESSENEFVQDQDDFGKFTDVPFDYSRHEENSFESCRGLGSHTGAVVDNSTRGNIDTPVACSVVGLTDNEPPSDAMQSISSASDDDNVSSDDSVGLDIHTDYFQSVTLASFEIEKMELSPLGDDEASLDENEHKVISETAVISPRTCSSPLGSVCQKDAISDASSLVPGSGEEEEQARGKAILQSPSSDDESHAIGERLEECAAVSDIKTVAGSDANSPLGAEDPTMISDTRETVQRDRVNHAEKTVQVDPFELEQIEMVSCSVQTAPDENLSDEFVDADDAEDQLEDKTLTADVGCDAMDCMNIHDETCQYEEKAIPVDPYELGLQIKMVACSVQTDPDENFQIERDEGVSGDDSYGISTDDQLEDKTSTADVGCGAMGCIDIHGETCQSEEEAATPLVVSNEEPVGKRGLEVSSEADLACVSVVRKSSAQTETGGPGVYREGSGSTDIKLQNEMLELVYEMLREMRDAYFERVIEKPASSGTESLKEELKLETIPRTHSINTRSEASQKQCSCPSSPISHVLSAQKRSLDNTAASVSYLSRGTVKSSDNREISSKNGNRLYASMGRDRASPMSPKFENVANRTWFGTDHNRERTSPQLSLSRRTENKPCSFDGRSSVALPRTSRRDTGRYRNTIDRLSSSHTPAVNSLQKNQLDENDCHSPVHSLFAHDSETERIARIMQGSMKYWMKDDSSSSGWEDDSDEEETSDNCYF
ncbi:hypothetical protein V7S43_007451 [Phytophthora oleae]|uniref:C2 domain-containing protein n=1 Tax=Phytophthora oleae TaxID=2107226 RepID=A0ABD3FLM4_9STRA